MNIVKFLFSRFTDEELNAWYIKKNKPTAKQTHQRTRLGKAGYTRSIHEEPKYRRQMAARSRCINREYARR